MLQSNNQSYTHTYIHTYIFTYVVLGVLSLVMFWVFLHWVVIQSSFLFLLYLFLWNTHNNTNHFSSWEHTYIHTYTYIHTLIHTIMDSLLSVQLVFDWLSSVIFCLVTLRIFVYDHFLFFFLHKQNKLQHPRDYMFLLGWICWYTYTYTYTYTCTYQLSSY